MLTEDAIEAIRKAKIIYGSKRAIKLVEDHIMPETSLNAIEDFKTLNQLPEDAVVLSTGDPMLSGLGYLPGKVIPGISSMQLACARLKVSHLRVVPVTSHGRKLDPYTIAAELKRGKIVFLIADETVDLKGLCQYLENQGLSMEVVILDNLGYPEERITRDRTTAHLHVSSLSCVMIGHFEKE